MIILVQKVSSFEMVGKTFRKDSQQQQKRNGLRFFSEIENLIKIKNQLVPAIVEDIRLL